MKVCLLGDAGSVHLRRTAQGLAQRGHEVLVVTYKNAVIPGVAVERFVVPPPKWRLPVRWHRRRSWVLRRLMRRHDVVHINFLEDWGFTPEIAAEGCLIVTPWGSDVVGSPGSAGGPDERSEMKRALLRMARAVIVHGQAFASTVGEFAGICPDDILRVPLGVDLRQFKPAGKHEDRRLIVGFNKGFRSVYRPEVWIRAMPSVVAQFPDVRLELIGNGPLLKNCRALVKQLNVEHAVTWHDWIAHEQLPKRMERWSIAVIPSYHESFCVAALEAAAMQLPVVASRAGGLTETVRDGETGLLVPRDDPAALAAAVCRLLADPRLRQEYGVAGRRFVEARFNWPDCLTQLVDAYKYIRAQRRFQQHNDRISRFRAANPQREVVSATAPQSALGRDSTTFSDHAEKRVLMIAAAFPPTGGPGVQRSAKFAKYLPRFGWTPCVWTAGRLRGLPCDATLLAELPPEVLIHSRSGRFPRRTAPVIRARRSSGGMTLLSCMDLVPFPDDCAEWAKRSVSPLLEMLGKAHISVIYSTFSPPSNHLLALILKRHSGLPWIADFRDLWIDDYRYREAGAARRAAHRHLQQQILNNADMVIGVTEKQTDILSRYVPGRTEKFVTITNGFDPEDFPSRLSDDRIRRKEVLPRTPDGVFVLAHVGRFDRWRALDCVYEGLHRFIDVLGGSKEEFLVRIVGHADRLTRDRLCATGARCEFTGYVSHAEAVAHMSAADALLLSVPDGPNADSVIPAKLFEYLASGRPILVVGPKNGEAARITRQYKAGLCVPFDAAAICAALGRLAAGFRLGDTRSGAAYEALAPFSRVELAGRLGRLLDRCARCSGNDSELVGGMRDPCAA